MTLLDTAVAEIRKTRASSQLSGERAFTLHDTYGFPYDLTLELAADAGLTIDEDGFRRLMQQQRDAAKEDRAGQRHRQPRLVGVSAGARAQRRHDVFTGYEELLRESTVTVAARPGSGHAAAGGGGGRRGRDRPRHHPVLRGVRWPGGRPRAVRLRRRCGRGARRPDARWPGLIVHRVRVIARRADRPARPSSPRSTLAAGPPSRVRTRRPTWCIARSGVRSARSATQAGSLNAPGRLRFDFHSPSAVPDPSCAMSRTRSTRCCCATCRSARSSRRRTRRAGSARWRCSARSTATAVRVVDVGERERPTPASSAAARTSRARRSSAR